MNIRRALDALGFREEWRLRRRYDEQLSNAVLKFQAWCGHHNVDGLVGPGARRLLVRQLEKVDFDTSTLRTVFRYDVALSYASEDRQHVVRLRKALEKARVVVFPNDEAEARLWGEDLDPSLFDVYRHQAQQCVLFVSRAYRKKTWPQHELRAALARAREVRGGSYILPIRVDGSKLRELSSNVSYLKLTLGMSALCRRLLEKLGDFDDV